MSLRNIDGPRFPDPVSLVKVEKLTDAKVRELFGEDYIMDFFNRSPIDDGFDYDFEKAEKNFLVLLEVADVDYENDGKNILMVEQVQLDVGLLAELEELPKEIPIEFNHIKPRYLPFTASDSALDCDFHVEIFLAREMTPEEIKELPPFDQYWIEYRKTVDQYNLGNERWLKSVARDAWNAAISNGEKS